MANQAVLNELSDMNAPGAIALPIHETAASSAAAAKSLSDLLEAQVNDAVDRQKQHEQQMEKLEAIRAAAEREDASTGFFTAKGALNRLSGISGVR
jgi:hypothetical protein